LEVEKRFFAGDGARAFGGGGARVSAWPLARG